MDVTKGVEFAHGEAAFVKIQLKCGINCCDYLLCRLAQCDNLASKPKTELNLGGENRGMSFEESCLPQVLEGLKDVFGEDLAETIIKAASEKDMSAVNRQLLINDGLTKISPSQRAEALAFLDTIADIIR